MRKLTAIIALFLVLNLAACTPKNQTSATSTPTTTKPTTAAATSVATTMTTTAVTTTAATQATTKATPATTTTTTTTQATTIQATTAAATTKGVNILTGTFQEAEWGDYLHITIKGDDGKDYSFFVIKYPGVEVETLKAGQKVKVTWQNVDEILNPPGKTVNFDKVISIEIIQ